MELHPAASRTSRQRIILYLSRVLDSDSKILRNPRKPREILIIPGKLFGAAS